MGLKIGERMHLMDIDENTSFVFQKITYKHNIFIHVWDTYLVGHKFGVFTMLPFNIIYIHNYEYVSTVLWCVYCMLHYCNFKFSLIGI